MRFLLNKVTRAVLILLLLSLSGVLIIATHLPASADSGIALNSSTQAAFPNSITFNVSAQSTANIVQLRLHYVVNHQNFASMSAKVGPNSRPRLRSKLNGYGICAKPAFHLQLRSSIGGQPSIPPATPDRPPLYTYFR